MAAAQGFVEPSAATQSARKKFWQLQIFAITCTNEAVYQQTEYIC